MGGLGIPADSDQWNWVVHSNPQNTFLMTEVPPQKKKARKILLLFEKLNPKTPSHDMIQVAWYATGKHLKAGN